MLPDELLNQIQRLDDEDKVRLFWLLRDDPALSEIAPEVTGLRYNYEAARILLEMIDQHNSEQDP